MTTTQALEQARALRMTWLETQKMPFTQDEHDRRIAAALKRAYADGLQSGTRYMSAYWANQAVEIASKMHAEADALESE